MAKAKERTIQMDNPDIDSGFENVTIGRWLVQMMDMNHVSNVQLANYLSVTQPAVANWRRDDSPLPLERLPVIFQCLGLSDRDSKHWGFEIAKAYLPEPVHQYLRDPMKEAKDNMLQIVNRASIEKALEKAERALADAKAAL